MSDGSEMEEEMVAAQQDTFYGNIVRLRLLGSPQLWLGEEPVVPRTRKSLALLVYLVLQGGHQSREHLADLFWPDADAEDARASLRTTLSYVRHALGSYADACIEATRETVGISPTAPLDVDVHEMGGFQRLVCRSHDLGVLRRQVESAIELCCGPFLEGLSLPDAPDFEAWMEGQRSHWRRVAAELLEHLAALQLQDGDTNAAFTSLERWAAVDPDEESAWKKIIELHVQCEDWSGARRAWKRYREALAELDAEPSPEMLAVAQRIDPTAAEASRPEEDSRGVSLPTDSRTLPFVGRRQEWAALHAALERSRRGRPEVVILEGAAGVGKSRLMSQFRCSARSLGSDTLVGRAFQTVGDLPYAAVVDALRTRLEDENAPDDLLGDLWLSELTRLLPELRERYPDLPVVSDDSTFARGRLFEAVARLGQALGGRAPLVLCLDDVQWTDGVTRDLLRYALRRWADSSTPVLLVLTVRSEDLETDPGLVHWLGTLERETASSYVPMDALDRDDVVALLSHLAGPSTGRKGDAPSDALREFGSWLAGRTGGHPLALVEAIHALLAECVLEVRPTGNGDWAIEIPDALPSKHGGSPDIAALSPAPAAMGRFAHAQTGAPRERHVLYPMAAPHVASALVASG